MKRSRNRAWLDTETTGLDGSKVERLELGLVITTPELEVLHAAGYPVWDDRRTDEAGRNDPFIIDMHTRNGLWSAREHQGIKLSEAEALIIEAIKQYGAEGSPMCGSTISYDRAVLGDSPILKVLHYRNIDVSSLRELAEDWGYPLAPKGQGLHRAVPDCLDSVAALVHYRKTMFIDYRRSYGTACPNEGDI